MYISSNKDSHLKIAIDSIEFDQIRSDLRTNDVMIN